MVLLLRAGDDEDDVDLLMRQGARLNRLVTDKGGALLNGAEHPDADTREPPHVEDGADSLEHLARALFSTKEHQ